MRSKKSGEVAKKNSSVIPLYSRIESQIRNMILSGRYLPGEKLPTETKLVQTFGVSKITIRGALGNLEADGLIIRTPGKGTFVADEVPLQKQIVVSGGVYDIVSRAEKYAAQVLGVDPVIVGDTRSAGEISRFLGLYNTDQIGMVRRVRYLKSTPIMYVENFLPLEMFEHLTAAELSKKPLLRVLKEKIGLVVGRGEMFIEAVPAEADVADVFQCQMFDPLIFIQVYYWFKNGGPFEVVNLHMKAEFFKYKVELDAKGFENI